MIALRVIPPTKEEGAKVDGAEGMGGAVVLDHLECSYASLCLTVVVFMAHITWKWSKREREQKKGIKFS